jgi:hypothetical protein
LRSARFKTALPAASSPRGGLIPTPLSAKPRAGGYRWDLSMRHVEVSRTLVSTTRVALDPFFEALIADNIGIGRPEEVSLVFARQVRRTTREPFGTRIFTAGTDLRIELRYKHSRVKQYLKDGRALRVEAVINKPKDLDVPARFPQPPRTDRQGTPSRPAAV